MTVLRTIRFLVGATLVAAGGTLVAPLATKLLVAARLPHADDGVTSPSALEAAAPDGAAAAPVVNPPSHASSPPPADPKWPPAPEPAWAPVGDVVAADSAGGLQLDRSPPPPPAPLPPPPDAFAQANPALGAAYRSMLHVPPPPLLDTEAPPPAAPAWTVSGRPHDRAPSRPATGPGDIAVPATYRIVDGDDLGTIAGRFYGHPAAASVIWAANRDLIPDPQLLPIGADLRLPPSWAVQGHGRPSDGAIEPVAYARPVLPAVGAGGQPVGAAPAPWLAPAPAPPAAAMPPRPPAQPAAPQPLGVRVGAGETLTSLARRLYGDPAMAERIFAVNRDRLRSPELVVPGMELRLPQPVTAPRS